jgi:TonB-linked SusC/RagA family outer membrane protein
MYYLYQKTCKFMKLSFLLLFVCVAQLLAVNAKGQNAVIHLSSGSLSVGQFLSEVENQTNYLVIYSNREVDTQRKIALEASSGSVSEYLGSVFAGTSIRYEFDSDYIILTNRPAGVTAAVLQGISIAGTVVDSEGVPMPGVNVVVKGSLHGTVTDVDGKYSITVPAPAEGAVLTFSFIGFVTSEKPVEGTGAIDVVMAEQSKMIDEVVVIGYGTRQRKSVTGAIDQVGSDVFENRPVSNAMQALQGASPNLIIQQKSMNPNDNSMNINIRGVSTMGSNDPLIVIDGLISGTGTLNNLNPADIENVSVLKDAGSAAIYGSRSNNGVILVTTRKGTKSTKPTVRFNGMIGYQDPHILYQPVEGWQNAMYRNQANMNVGTAPMYTPAQIRDLYEHQNEEYWYMNEIMKKGLQQTYNMSVAGGNENTTYMISAGYFDQESNFEGDFGMERFNVRSNITTEYGRFKLSSLMAYTRKNEVTLAGGTGNTIINSSRIPPYYWYKFQEDNKWLVNEVIGDDNAMAKLTEGGNENKDEDNFIGSMNLDFKIIEGLKARGLVGLDLTQHHRFRRDKKVPLYASVAAQQPSAYINPNTITEDYNRKWYTLSTQFLLDFDRTFNTAHHVTGLIGVSNESYTSKGSRIAWENTDEDLGLPTTDTSVQSTGNNNSNADTDQTSISSLFGRAGYDYMNKYYVDFSFRYDGSSKFNKDHRWGFFPSFSAAYRLSEEGFMDTYKTNIGELKLRGSYGVLGNQNVDNYSYQTTYQMYNNSYVFGGVTVPGTGYTYGNELLTWEKSANFNIGIDASFLKGTLFVALDYFNKHTWDILLSPTISRVFGAGAANENAGEMKNRGWEATINYRLKTGEVNHNFNLNVSDSKNEVIDFGGKEKIDNNDEVYKIVREGEALGSYFGLETDGLFQSYDEIANSVLPVGASIQPGDVRFVNQNDDAVIDEKDRVVLGNAFPRMTFGFTYSASFKGFDFSMLLQGVGKRDMIVRGELIEPFHSSYSYCIYQHQLDFWTPTNPNARWPRLVAPSSRSSANNWAMKGTDIFLLNGAYLRMKNIQLGYTLPKQITAKVGIQSLRISVTAQNLFTFTKNSFVDPESSEFGSNMGGIGGVAANSARNYPTLRYYGVGLDVEF